MQIEIIEDGKSVQYSTKRWIDIYLAHRRLTDLQDVADGAVGVWLDGKPSDVAKALSAASEWLSERDRKDREERKRLNSKKRPLRLEDVWNRRIK